MAKPIRTLPFEHRSNFYPYDGLDFLVEGANSSFKGTMSRSHVTQEEHALLDSSSNITKRAQGRRKDGERL